MTTAKILGALPEGCALTSSLNEALYQQLIKKGSAEQLVAIVVLDPIGTGQRKTAKGMHRHVELQIARLEILERKAGDDVDRVLIEAERSASRRRTPGQQLTVTGDSEADRLALLRECQTWADNTGRDLDAEWDVYYDPEFIARPDKASYRQLQEFAFKHGIGDVSNPVVDDQAPTQGEEDEDASDLGDDGGEVDAGDAVAGADSLEVGDDASDDSPADEERAVAGSTPAAAAFVQPEPVH